MKGTTFLVMIMLIMAFSCNPDGEVMEVRKSDRLSFRDMDDFNDTYLSLSKMSSSNELQRWAREKGHSTRLAANDTIMEQYSDALRTILNEDSEFEVGDNIIWFHDGNLYSFTKSQYSQISELKKTPEKCTKYGEVSSLQIGTITDNSNGRVNDTGVALNGLQARNQKEFTQQYYQPCGSTLRALNGIRKYVHEVWDETIAVAPGPVRYSNLYLRIKLEYKGSKWRPAGEQRETTVNVSGWAQIVGAGLGQANYSINTSLDCYSGNWNILIAQASHGPYYEYPPYWVLRMDGEIYHRVKGDLASNAWSNTECTLCTPSTLLW